MVGWVNQVPGTVKCCGSIVTVDRQQRFHPEDMLAMPGKQHRHPNAEADPIEGLIQYHTERLGIVRGHCSLCAEWAFEQVARPFDRVAEKLLGQANFNVQTVIVPHAQHYWERRVQWRRRD
jgi:hypothetical protein